MNDDSKAESIYEKLRRQICETENKRVQEERERQSMLEDFQGVKPLIDQWNNPGGDNK